MPALIVAAVLVACVVALLTVSEKAEASFPGKNGRIAFDAYTPERGLRNQIFTINPDGTGEKQLTHSSSSSNHSPSYSPDGTKIAWVRNGDIWEMDADGTGKHRLTSTPAYDSGPAYSPDGRKLAFTRDARAQVGADIYIKKLKDGRVRRVTGGGKHNEYDAVFSPDGSRIAFLRQRFSDPDVILREAIATVRPDGTGLRVLTPPKVSPRGGPDWSPDGRKLVFAIYLTVNGRIQTVEADGTNRQTVFAPGPRFYPYGPVFSPDGKKIAFGNDHEGRHIADSWNIWTVGAHGKNPTYLTRPSAAGRVELRTDWGPRPTGQ
jgi:Tol biopolymer transport system component